MAKRSEIVPSGNMGRFVKSITDMVTGNPIVEEPSPIKKDQNRRLRSSIRRPNKQPTRTSPTKPTA